MRQGKPKTAGQVGYNAFCETRQLYAGIFAEMMNSKEKCRVSLHSTRPTDWLDWNEELMQGPWNILFGRYPKTFESAYDFEESVRILQAATKRSVFSSFLSQNAVGRVSAKRVSLQRVIPFVGNSSKPFFVGRFERKNGKVVLEGHFTIHLFAKIFMSIWFGFVILGIVLTTYQVIAAGTGNWQLPFFDMGLFLAGFIFVLIGKWFARNDIAWLSRIISAALKSNQSS